MILTEYKHGHCNVPKADGSLGRWVTNIRSRVDTLVPERHQKLKEIGFLFRLQYAQDEEIRFLKELTDFKERNGHSIVDDNVNNHELCQWLEFQKARILRPNDSNIRSIITTDDKIKLVLELGIFDSNGEDDSWNNSFKNLIKYCSEHGNQPGDIINETKIYNFYRNNKYRSTQANRIIRNLKLDLFNFNGSSRGPIFFTDIDTNEGAISSDSDNSSVEVLGSNIITNSTCYGLDEEISASEDETAGGQDRRKSQSLRSESLDEAWFAKLNDLKNYKKKNGHCNVPVNGSSLGRWTQSQRKYYHLHPRTFRTDRFEELKRIGFHFKLRYTLDEVSSQFSNNILASHHNIYLCQSGKVTRKH